MAYTCAYCGKEFSGPVTSGHTRMCPEFLKANPDRRPPPCLSGHESTSLTQMKRHRKGCDVWKSRDKEKIRQARQKETFEKKYGKGIDNAACVPGSAEKRAATNLKRYGAPNPFCKGSSLYEQVQSYWDGKDRTAHLDKNNFARPEIKKKIRE